MKRYKVNYIDCHGYTNTVEINANDKEQAEWVVRTYCVITEIIKVEEVKGGKK